MFDYFLHYYIEQRFGWNFWACEIVFIVGMVLLLDMPRPGWKPILICLGKMAGAFAACLLLNCLAYLIFNQPMGRSFTYPIILASYALFICRYKMAARIPMACAFYSAYILSLAISETIGFMIEEAMDLNGQTPTAFITVLLVSAASIVYFRLFSYEKFPYVPWSASLLSSSLFLIGAIVTLTINRLSGNEDSRNLTLLVSSAFTLITVGGYLMFYYICRSYSDNLQLKLKEKKMEAEQEYARLTKQNLEELRKARHDIKNYYGYMKALIEQGKYAEAGDYLGQLEEKIMPSLSLESSGNSAIDTVISMERRKAEEASISLQTRFLSLPPTLEISDADLTSILSNLIDNAIEATVRSESMEPIKVQILQRGNYLFINVSNPVSQALPSEQILTLKTNKGDESIHGYGTKIVKELAERHEGTCRFSISDGRFQADVMLLNRKGE